MKKPETYTCPECGCFLPKKDVKVSGWDSQLIPCQKRFQKTHLMGAYT